MRILVAERIADEGIDVLRTRHDVDVRTGLSPDKLRDGVADYDALARPQPGQGRRAAHRGRVAARRHRSCGCRRRQRRPRRGHTRRRHGRQCADRQHDRGCRAYARAAAWASPGESRPLTPPCAAASGSGRRSKGVEVRGKTLPASSGSARLGSAHRGPRPRSRDDCRGGHDPYVTAEQASLHGVEACRLDSAPGPERRRQRPRAADARDGRTSSVARRIAKMKPERFAAECRAQQHGVDEAALADILFSGQGGWRGDRRLRGRSRRVHRCLSAPNTILTPHLGASTAGRLGRRGRGGCPVACWTCSMDGPRVRRSTRRSSAPRRPGTIAPFLPLAETLGRLLHRPVRTDGDEDVTFESPVTPADHDPTPLTAAMLRGLLQATTEERVNLVNAGLLAQSPRHHGRRAPGARGRRPTPRFVTVSGEVGGQRVTVGGTVERRRATSLVRLERLPARHGALGGHADHAPQRPARHDRASRPDPR